MNEFITLAFLIVNIMFLIQRLTPHSHSTMFQQPKKSVRTLYAILINILFFIPLNSSAKLGYNSPEEMYQKSEYVLIGEVLERKNDTTFIKNIFHIKGKTNYIVPICDDLSHSEGFSLIQEKGTKFILFLTKKNNCFVGKFGYNSSIFISQKNCIYTELTYDMSFPSKEKPLESLMEFIEKMTGSKKIILPELFKAKNGECI